MQKEAIMANGSDTYRTLFDLYLSGYQATSTSLRSKSENETIDSALSTFGGLTDKTDEEIARLTASEDKGDTSAADDMTTILEAGFSNIKDIFAKAVDWDAAHVKEASTTSQANVAKVANDQEATDQELVANLDGLISKAREALLRAAGRAPVPQHQTDPDSSTDPDGSAEGPVPLCARASFRPGAGPVASVRRAESRLHVRLHRAFHRLARRRPQTPLESRSRRRLLRHLRG